MLNFAWRWAEVGDAVLVHSAKEPLLPPASGVVVNVERSRGTSRLGIRLGADGGSRIEWPSQQRVHSDPVDPEERCWRCEEAAASGPRPQVR